jgi:hypothetical protein
MTHVLPRHYSTNPLMNIYYARLHKNTIDSPSTQTRKVYSQTSAREREGKKPREAMASKLSCNWVDEPSSFILEDLINDVILFGD